MITLAEYLPLFMFLFTPDDMPLLQSHIKGASLTDFQHNRKHILYPLKVDYH